MGARSSQSRGPGLNKSDGHLLEYFRQNFGAGGAGTNPSPGTGHVATGGVISDYTVGGDVYRAHIFYSSGIFNVTTLGTFDGGVVDYLLVGGGGGGGTERFTPGPRGAGGGGAGLLVDMQKIIQSQPDHTRSRLVVEEMELV